MLVEQATDYINDDSDLRLQSRGYMSKRLQEPGCVIVVDKFHLVINHCTPSKPQRVKKKKKINKTSDGLSISARPEPLFVLSHHKRLLQCH